MFRFPSDDDDDDDEEDVEEENYPGLPSANAAAVDLRNWTSENNYHSTLANNAAGDHGVDADDDDDIILLTSPDGPVAVDQESVAAAQVSPSKPASAPAVAVDPDFDDDFGGPSVSEAPVVSRPRPIVAKQPRPVQARMTTRQKSLESDDTAVAAKVEESRVDVYLGFFDSGYGKPASSTSHSPADDGADSPEVLDDSLKESPPIPSDSPRRRGRKRKKHQELSSIVKSPEKPREQSLTPPPTIAFQPQVRQKTMRDHIRSATMTRNENLVVEGNVQLEPELLALKHSYELEAPSTTSSASVQKVAITILAFKDQSNVIAPATPLVRVMNVRDTLESVISEYCRSHLLNMQLSTFLYDESPISYLSSPAVLWRGTGKPVEQLTAMTIEAMTPNFYKLWSLKRFETSGKGQSQQMEEAITASVNATTAAQTKITIKINSKKASTVFRTARSTKIAAIVQAYRQEHEIGAEVAIKVKFDGEVLGEDMSLEDVDIDEDDQIDITVAAS